MDNPGGIGMTTLLTDAGEFQVSATDGLWLTPEHAERATGWVAKPEGMCRGEVCVPLPAALRSEDRVDVAAFWERLGRPVVHDSAGETWVLGAGAEERNRRLAGTTAPDFTLPDLAGMPHQLHDLRGSKVFLATWASW
jgi:hypothetical protein